MAKEIFFSLSSDKAVVNIGHDKNRYEEVELGEVQMITPGYTYRPFKFTAPNLRDCIDGAIYELAPYVATQPAFITKKVSCIDRVLTGNGVLLVVRPDKLFYVRFAGRTDPTEKSTDLEPEAIYNKGSLITWIAGESGLILLGTTRPISTPDMEILVRPGKAKIRGRTIPEVYWKSYETFTSRPKTQKELE